MIRATFPEEYILAVEGDRHCAEALLRESGSTPSSFTGSTRVGRAVMARRHITSRRSPSNSAANAPASSPPTRPSGHHAARRVVWGKFMNAGQTCVAPDFISIERRVHDDFVEALQRVIRGFYGADPRQNQDYGRIINRRHFDRLTGYLASVGHVECGGQRDPADLYLALTVLARVRRTPVMQDEIGCSIASVIAVESMEEAWLFSPESANALALAPFPRPRSRNGCWTGRVPAGCV